MVRTGPLCQKRTSANTNCACSVRGGLQTFAQLIKDLMSNVIVVATQPCMCNGVCSPFLRYGQSGIEASVMCNQLRVFAM